MRLIESQSRRFGRALTGAWIETASDGYTVSDEPRRALTGAWIETETSEHDTPAMPSRALTGAWIETLFFESREIGYRRALTGAWIETLCPIQL